jgi:Transposase DDE domain group 1
MTARRQRYCARGKAENRIKEAQLDLCGRRASCHRFQPNPVRLLLTVLTCTLMINLRRLALRAHVLGPGVHCHPPHQTLQDRHAFMSAARAQAPQHHSVMSPAR